MSLDKEKNQCVREKTGAQHIVKEIKQYEKKWLQHVQRMETNRIPKQAQQYRPKGRRNIGRPRKRWRDRLHLGDQGTGNMPNTSRNLVKEIKQYQQKWLQHVQRMDTNRIPKQALQYRPKGRRNIGRPRKRWRDRLHLEDQGTGNTPNTS
jgi:2-keto-3-deoxy-L-rhamnonate aldolase RhmA